MYTHNTAKPCLHRARAAQTVFRRKKIDEGSGRCRTTNSECRRGRTRDRKRDVVSTVFPEDAGT